jgi:Zn-dependent protease with chaperone function
VRYSASPAEADRAPAAIFRLELVIGVCGIVAMAAAVTAATESIHRQTIGAHRIVFEGLKVTYPTLNVAAGALLALAVLGAVVLLTAVWEAVHQARATGRLVRGLRVLGPLSGHADISLVDHPAPEAFCVGLLRPRIFISTAAVELLDADQLAAVVEHERHHRHARDPLRLMCGRVLARAVFFLPILRPLRDRYADVAEQHADYAAVRDGPGGRAALAGALLAFDASAPPGTSGISPHRVDSLLGAAPRWRPPAALVGLTVAALAGLVVLIWRASRTAAASATFDLPVVSSQPCVLVLALVPLIACLAAVTVRIRVRPARPYTRNGAAANSRIPA